MASFSNNISIVKASFNHVHCIDFVFQQDPSFGSIPMKIHLIVVEYELIT